MNYLAGLPKEVRIGPYKISIVVTELDDDISGEFSFGRLGVRISPKQPSAVFAADTVLHELLHAIWRIYNIRQDDLEEKMVTCVALAMVQMFHDNPGLVGWLVKSTK